MCQATELVLRNLCHSLFQQALKGFFSSISEDQESGLIHFNSMLLVAEGATHTLFFGATRIFTTVQALHFLALLFALGGGGGGVG